MAGLLILSLFLIGAGGMILCDNLVKKVMALSITDGALVILFAWSGSLEGESAPILLAGTGSIVDPIPQALMLTAIVIGICLTAVALAIVFRLYGRYGTLSLRKIQELQAVGHE